MKDCPICLQVQRQPIRVSPCGHMFCSDCINTWRSRNSSNRCPCCRGEIYLTETLSQYSDFTTMTAKCGVFLTLGIAIVVLSSLYFWYFNHDIQLDDEKSQDVISESPVWDTVISVLISPWTLIRWTFNLAQDCLHWIIFKLVWNSVFWVMYALYHYIVWPIYFISTFCFHATLNVLRNIYSVFASLFMSILMDVMHFSRRYIRQPFLDFVRIFVYVLWDGIWATFKNIYIVVRDPILMLHNIIIIISVSLCIMIYNIVTSLVAILLLGFFTICLGFFCPDQQTAHTRRPRKSVTPPPWRSVKSAKRR